MQPLLSMENITKKYGAHYALQDMSLCLMPGEIVGLVGENGSGKSTLLKILLGTPETRDYQGDIYWQDQKVRFKSTKEAMSMGIGMVFQELSLINRMMVYENIKMTMENTYPWSKFLPYHGQMIDPKKDIADSQKVLDQLALSISPLDRVSNLSLESKSFVEISREIHKNNIKLLVLDEPTASLGEKSRKKFLENVLHIKKLGIGIILVSHNLKEIQQICDKVLVLRDGICQGEFLRGEFDYNKILQAMLGSDLAYFQRRDSTTNQNPILTLKDFEIHSKTETLQIADLEILEGEILGFTGLNAQGKSLLNPGLMGLLPTKGHLLYNGISIENRNTAWRNQRGFHLIPEERKEQALMMNQSIMDNLLIGESGKEFRNFLGLVQRKKLYLHSQKMIQKLRIKTSGPKDKLAYLSGGNQQKVAIAKAITAKPKLLLVGEPTRGIDVGSKETVLSLLQNLNAIGNTSIVIASSELEELIKICDRIGVITNGHLVGVFDNNQENIEKIEDAIYG